MKASDLHKLDQDAKKFLIAYQYNSNFESAQIYPKGKENIG